MAVLVPRKLARLSPLLFQQATRAKSQVEADRLIRILLPDWTGDTMNVDAWKRHIGVDRHQAQAAGTYSLDLCQGGARYHEPSPSTVRVAEPDEHHNLVAVVDVPDSYAHPPVPTRKRAPKSYLPQFDPRGKDDVLTHLVEFENPLLNLG